MAVEHISDSDFESRVLNSEMPVLVDFWAPWCGPCKRIGPLVEEVASGYEGKLLVMKINVDENQETATKFGVRSIPTVFIFRGGEIVERVVGLVSRGDLVALVDRSLGAAA